MSLERCPHCNNSYLNFSMDYRYGNPVIVYTCENCKYTTFGEAYITTDNKTTVTVGNSTRATNTTTIYEPTGTAKKNNGMTTFTVG